jgi:hypothetical protein
VSYGAEREAHASIEEGCFVLESHGAVRMLSCNVVQGSSGAPVMRVTEDGPEIVAVISAMATDRTGRDVSMAVALEGPFAELLDQTGTGRAARRSVRSGHRRSVVRGARMAAGRASARGSSGPEPSFPRGLETPFFIAHVSLVPMPDAGRRIHLDGARMPGPLRTSLSLNGG